MHRKHPNARRATALTLLTSMFLVFAAASAVAIHPSPANAGISAASPPVVNSRTPLPGDPNTPDEGRGGGSYVKTTTSVSVSPARNFFEWVKEFTHHLFLAPR